MSESLPSSALSHPSPTPDSVGIILCDACGLISHANRAAHALCQINPGELVGLSFGHLLTVDRTPDDVDSGPASWADLFQSLSPPNLTVTVRCRLISAVPEGEKPVLRVEMEKLTDVGFLATLHPATSGGESSKLAPHRLYPLLEHGAAGFFELDVATGRTVYTPTWKRILGYEEAELPDTIDAWRQLIHPDDSAAAPDRLSQKTSSGPRPFNVEFRMRHRTGHWVWVQSVGVQLLGATGQLERVIGLHLDISERKELEEASLTNDERLDLIGSAGPLGVFDFNFATNTFWFSPRWRTILGYRTDELPDDLASFTGALPEDERAAGAETWIQLRAPGQPTVTNSEMLVGKEGRQIPVLFGMHRTFTRKRELSRVTGFIFVAPQSGDPGLPTPLLQAAFETLAEGVLITNAAGKIVHLNPAACRLLGVQAEEVRDELASQVFRLVQRETGEPSSDAFTRALAEHDALPLFTDSVLPARTEEGVPQPIVWTARTCRDGHGRPQGVVILFRDPAEISLTPEELIKANRLESLGVVAGGIAHDFNDLLTTILAGISLNKDGRDLVALEESEKACLSAKGLTKQLLAFAKGSSTAQVVMTADEVLHTPVKLASAGSDAVITVEVAEGTETVRVDRLQIAQVFQNLILNALQAMPGPPHRARVHLRAANTTLAADQIPPLPAGTYVEFEVRDNASGIAPEYQQRIFEPFFTTHKHRTGLGLPTALAIVRKNGGQIGVVSTPGEGTAFTVFLPCAEAPLLPQPPPAHPPRFRTGRILFMDDDPKITALTAGMLTSLDYSFDLARNGTEAIQLYNRYLNIGRPYDVVILDVTVVGGMGGEECYKALRDADPEVRAIICTGFENDAMGRRYLDLGFSGYLTKPYRIADLGKVLKSVLN